MPTISIYANSPNDKPGSMTLRMWDEEFAAKGAGVVRKSADDDVPVYYDDPNGVVTQAVAEGIAGPGWMVSIA